MEHMALVGFGAFLVGMMFLDFLMILSLVRTGDERKQLIVWKASTATLLIMVLTLVFDVVESVVRVEPMAINPFIKLSVTAVVYFVALLTFRKRYGG